MKILLLSTAAGGSGAYVAASRLLHALRAAGADASMLVRDGRPDDAPGVLPPVVHSRWHHTLATARTAAEYAWLAPHMAHWRDIFQFSGGWLGWNLAQHPAVQAADILNLHWIGKAFLSLSDLLSLARLGKPIVWTLHDMWAFTGGCHYSRGCTQYETNCGTCPFLRHPHPTDISRAIWQRKHHAWQQLKPHIVTSSTWLRDCARASSLLSPQSVEAIPIPVDPDVFAPLPQAEARQRLGLPSGPLLLFGASRIRDPRKGWPELLAALAHLRTRLPDEALPGLAVFGQIEPEVPRPEGYRVHELGRIGPAQLQAAYSAADAYVIPSLEDNLPNTVLEALGCGAPIVAFGAGGIPDLVQHHTNGYLAPTGDTHALAQGLHWLLTHPDAPALRQASRHMALTTFHPRTVASQYLAHFQRQLAR